MSGGCIDVGEIRGLASMDGTELDWVLVSQS